MDITAFQEYILEALEALPEEFQSQLHNLEIIVEDEPDEDQRELLKLRRFDRLYGLYTGVPQIVPGEDRVTLPDRITIFRRPILESFDTIDEIKKQVRDTLYHEIGHYFGLEESRLRELQHGQ